MLASCPARSGAAVADAIKSAVGVQPSGVEHKTLRRMDLVRYLAGGHTTYPPEGFVAGSDVIGTTNPAAAQAIVAAIGTWPPAAGRASALIDSLGGAVGDMDPEGSAFPWCRQSAVVQWYVNTPSDGQGGDGQQMAERRTPRGATLFGRRLCQLPGGQRRGVTILRREPVAADHSAAQVRSRPDHVLGSGFLYQTGR